MTSNPNPLTETLSALEQHDAFAARHIGTTPAEQAAMLSTLGFGSRREMIDAIVPPGIRASAPLALPGPVDEAAALARLKAIAAHNRVLKSFIGQGYYGTFTPGVILRNILENPAWYTAYTPYQPEISQGRLEALINFQTMVCDLTGMAIANASMLDEATAAAEAMTLCQRMATGARGRAGASSSPPTASRRRGTSCARAPSRWASRWSSVRPRTPRPQGRSACCSSTRVRTATSATSRHSQRPSTPRAGSSSSRRTSSRSRC